MELRNQVGAVRREIRLEAGIEDVSSLVFTPAGLSGWLADELELERVEPGAEGTARDAGEERLVRIEQVEPGRRLTLTWCSAEGEAQASLVEITLDALAAAATRLVVVEIPLERLRVVGRELAAGAAAAGAHGPRLAAAR